MREASDVEGAGCSVCRKRGLCENGQEVLRGKGMLVGVIAANACSKR